MTAPSAHLHELQPKELRALEYGDRELLDFLEHPRFRELRSYRNGCSSAQSAGLRLKLTIPQRAIRWTDLLADAVTTGGTVMLGGPVMSTAGGHDRT